MTLGQGFAAYGQMLRQPAAVGLLLARWFVVCRDVCLSPPARTFLASKGWSPSAYALVFAMRWDFYRQFHQ